MQWLWIVLQIPMPIPDAPKGYETMTPLAAIVCICIFLSAALIGIVVWMLTDQSRARRESAALGKEFATATKENSAAVVSAVSAFNAAINQFRDSEETSRSTLERLRESHERLRDSTVQHEKTLDSTCRLIEAVAERIKANHGDTTSG